MTLEQKLIVMRTERNISQREAAELMGVHYNSYARVERGKLKASDRMYKKLADFFGVTEAFLKDDNVDYIPKNPVEKTGKASEGKSEGTKKVKASVKKTVSSGNSVKKNTVKKETFAEVKSEKTAPSYSVELQYAGKSISYDDIIKKAAEVSGNEGKDMAIYIKPEENRVYYVLDGKPGSFEI